MLHIDMTIAVLIACLVACAVAAGAFLRPQGVFTGSAIAAAAALAAPDVIAFVAGPFLGDGAGMGVALIIYVCTAAVLVVALAASLGAAAHYAWAAWHPGADRHRPRSTR